MKQHFEIKNKEDFNKFLNIFNPFAHRIVREGVKQPFVITIKPIVKSKSWEQLKGLYILCSKMVPYFREWTGEPWDWNQVKEILKQNIHYSISFKGNEVTKSCADATMEEMIMLINEAERFGAELNIPDIKLESRYLIELENYYNNEGN